MGAGAAHEGAQLVVGELKARAAVRVAQGWQNLASAHRLGVALAYGTDAGSFP